MVVHLAYAVMMGGGFWFTDAVMIVLNKPVYRKVLFVEVSLVEDIYVLCLIFKKTTKSGR